MRSRLASLLRERMRMLREDALAVAQVVDDAFRGHSELDDDLLDPHTRQVFYDLQDQNILDVRRQEYIKDGRQLRGYFWTIDGQDTKPAGPVAPTARDDMSVLYEDLADAAWTRKPQV